MLSLGKNGGKTIFVFSCMDIKSRVIHRKSVTAAGQREVKE